jgi:HEAT repeat protein
VDIISPPGYPIVAYEVVPTQMLAGLAQNFTPQAFVVFREDAICCDGIFSGGGFTGTGVEFLQLRSDVDPLAFGLPAGARVLQSLAEFDAGTPEVSGYLSTLALAPGSRFDALLATALDIASPLRVSAAYDLPRMTTGVDTERPSVDTLVGAIATMAYEDVRLGPMCEAAANLGRQPQAVAAAVGGLTCGGVEVAARCGSLIARYGGEAAAFAIASALHPSNPRCVLMCGVLGRMGLPIAVPALTDLALSGGSVARAAALLALGDMRCAEGLWLSAYLAQAEDLRVATAALYVLSRLRASHPEALEALQDLQEAAPSDAARARASVGIANEFRLRDLLGG